MTDARKHLFTTLIISVILISTLLFLPAHAIELSEDNELYQADLVWPNIQITRGMAQLPDGRMLTTERSGSLLLLTEYKPAISITGLPEIHTTPQGGLLDVALHPEFEQNNFIFFTYASQDEQVLGSNTTLIRASLDIDNYSLSELKVLYKAEDISISSVHYSSRIVIDGDYIYFTIGDRGLRNFGPQSLNRDGGKVYRLNLDGSIPNDNPFIDDDNAIQAVYSYGHHNPQGLIKLGDTGKIWSHEYGPKGGDEVNLIESGNNYGWPVISHGLNYKSSKFNDLTKKNGMEQPKFYWGNSIEPSGMAYIDSDRYPQWQGKVLLGSMKHHHLVMLDIEGDEVIKQTKLLANIGGRVRSVMQGRDGYIYLGVDGKGIYRIGR